MGMNLKKTVVVAFLLFAVCVVSAQKIRRTNNFESYKDQINEFGYSINLSYLKYGRTFSPQLHLHLSRYLTSFFSLGLGYSALFDEYYHNTFSLEGGLRVSDNLIFSLKPGIVLKRVRGDIVFLYSVGFETNYEFELNETVHIGPMIELDIVQDDVNYLMGFHMGLTF